MSGRSDRRVLGAPLSVEVLALLLALLALTTVARSRSCTGWRAARDAGSTVTAGPERPSGRRAAPDFGLTLVDLLVVTVVLGILTGIAVFTVAAVLRGPSSSCTPAGPEQPRAALQAAGADPGGHAADGGTARDCR